MLVKTRLERLFEAHRQDAVRLAFLLTGNAHTAEDVAQEAFIRVFARFGDLRDADAFLAYLRRTVINLSKDHHRKVKRERTAIEAFSRLETQEAGSELPEEQGRILATAATLPRRQFVAIVLRYCEGLTEMETADVLQSSVSAVKSLTSRGLATLRRSLEESDAEVT